MIPKNINQIEQIDLQNLIDQEVREGKVIEYKRDLYGDTADEKKEFLADVSSFANTAGGDLIIGMDEEQGLPTQIVGVTLSNPDQAIQRLENIIRDGLEPRLPGVDMHLISLQAPQGKHVILIRIRKSWIAPHRVTFRGDSKFYGRNSTGKYPLDVPELRTAFLLTESIAERIRNFRIDRIAKINANQTPTPINEGIKLILHLIPLTAFTGGASIDFRNPERDRLIEFSPLAGSGFDSRLNLDGYLNFTGVRGQPSHAYTQLYRNGIVEAVHVYITLDGNKRNSLPSVHYEQIILRGLSKYLNNLQSLNIEPPIYIFLTLTGVANTVLEISPEREYPTVDRDELILPEVTIEEYGIDLAIGMQQLFDMVWNAYGLSRSFNYDEQGNWKGR